jgi:hypothetical protein
MTKSCCLRSEGRSIEAIVGWPLRVGLCDDAAADSGRPDQTSWACDQPSLCGRPLSELARSPNQHSRPGLWIVAPLPTQDSLAAVTRVPAIYGLTITAVAPCSKSFAGRRSRQRGATDGR